MTFAEKLLLLRESKGLSVEELAEKLDVSRQAVSNWESKQSLPELSKIILMSELFEVSIDSLIKDDIELSSNAPDAVEEPGEASGTAISEAGQNTIFCTKCGRENRNDSAFCGYCGNPIARLAVTGSENGEMTQADIDMAYYRADLQLKEQAMEMQRRELDTAKRMEANARAQIRMQQMRDRSVMRCPRCGSTSLAGNKKGYGIGKGVVGAALVGPIGLVAGNIGANKVIVTCMKCGYRYKI